MSQAGILWKTLRGGQCVRVRVLASRSGDTPNVASRAAVLRDMGQNTRTADAELPALGLESPP